jgi:hypothetical protein
MKDRSISASARNGSRNLVPILTELPYVELEAPRTVVMKSYTFWDTTPCSLLKANVRFRETCRLQLQDRRISPSKKLLHAGFLVGLFFDTVDGGDIYLRNVGKPPDYKPSKKLLHSGFLLGLFFDIVDGGDIYLRNVGKPSPDYKPSKKLLHSGFLLGLFFDILGGGNIFLRNVR